MQPGSLLTHIFFVSSLSFCVSLRGQELNATAKVSPVADRRMQAARPGVQLPVQLVFTGNAPGPVHRKFAYKAITDSLFFADTTLSSHELRDLVKNYPGLVYVDVQRRAKEEYLINRFDAGTNAIDVVHDRYPEINGEGITVSVRETRVDTADIDLHGRYRHTELTPRVSNSHATIMATMLAGAGNSGNNGKGAAPGAFVTSASYENLFPDPLETLKGNNITVQNHSYGVGIENYYGADAAAYDAIAANDSVLLHIFSAGNSGLLKDSITQYPGGFANLTGSFKMAKNILCVGSTDAFGNVVAQSSRGPAYDGRVKPELVAFGTDGSSGAAALVSGTAVLLQQQYRNLFGSLPAASLVKAVLINSADDSGVPGPDYSGGYGSLHAFNAVNTIKNKAFFQGNAGSGEVLRFPLTIPAGANAVKCTLVWNDPPAKPNAVKALINDLDLELVNLSTGEVTRPWILSASGSVNDLTRPAIRGRDSINNVEQISAFVQSGIPYEIRVRAGAPLQGRQSFHIAYEFRIPDQFSWQFPLKSVPLIAGDTAVVRWKSGFQSPVGTLSWSSDSGRSWTLIDAGVEPGKQHFAWKVPPVNAAVILKMDIGSFSFLSDTVVLADNVTTGIGFNCADSLLFYWKKINNVNHYIWYRLGDKYMEPSPVITDSFVVVKKPTGQSVYYATAPVINGRPGPRSSVINAAQQGVGCYLRFFLISEENNSIVSRFSLGTLYNVKRILLEKFQAGQFIYIREFKADSSQTFTFRDTSLSNGLNTYRVRIEAGAGEPVYSAEESIFYFGRNQYVIYPNPSLKTRQIIIAQQIVAPATLDVFNSSGVRLHSQIIDDRLNSVQTNRFPPGLYFFQITAEDGKRQIQKVIIQ